MHPFLIMGAGIAMLVAFWLLLAVLVRAFRRAPGPVRPFVLAGCAALAVGTLQGPVQAFPAVNHLLHRSDEAGDVIVNLHAQLNMLGGLMVILVGLALALLGRLERTTATERSQRVVVVAVTAGMAVYYAAGIAFAAAEGHAVAGGRSFGHAVAALEPWQALVLIPAAATVLVGFAAYASATWRLTRGYRERGRVRMRAAPAAWTGRIPSRVRRRRPAAVAGSEIPMGLLGFPGVGWLFAGFPVTGTLLLIAGPALAWAVIPLAFSPFGQGPLRDIGWKVEFAWLPISTLVSAAVLYRAHRRRLRRYAAGPPGAAGQNGGPPGGNGGPPRRNGGSPRGRRRRAPSRARIAAGVGTIGLVLVSLPFIPALAGIGRGAVRYAYQTRLAPDITGQFLRTPRGTVKLFGWGDPQQPFPSDALRIHAAQVRSLVVRAAAVDRPGGYRLFDLTRDRQVPLAIGGRSTPRWRSRRRARSRPGATCSPPPTRGCSAGATTRT